MKQLTTGFIFALTCFTDPTYYAVMLMGGETGNFLSAVVLLTLWFLVSQFLAVIVYIANEMNLLEKLVDFIKKFKQTSQSTGFAWSRTSLSFVIRHHFFLFHSIFIIPRNLKSLNDFL